MASDADNPSNPIGMDDGDEDEGEDEEACGNQ